MYLCIVLCHCAFYREACALAVSRNEEVIVDNQHVNECILVLLPGRRTRASLMVL